MTDTDISTFRSLPLSTHETTRTIIRRAARDKGSRDSRKWRRKARSCNVTQCSRARGIARQQWSMGTTRLQQRQDSGRRSRMVAVVVSSNSDSKAHEREATHNHPHRCTPDDRKQRMQRICSGRFVDKLTRKHRNTATNTEKTAD